jgi:hypothetical protein
VALNRLGTLYAELGQHEVSLQYHLKHLDLLQGHDRFIAKYNVAIAMRLCQKFSLARLEIDLALQIVQDKSVSFEWC